MDTTATTNIYDMSEPKRRGMKPGQPNPGAFKKGDDPRRNHGMVIVDGLTFSAKARELGPAVLDWWHTLWQNEQAPFPVRLRASELIVERGFGKAASTIDINVNHRPLNTLTIEELEAIANGEQPRFPIALDTDVPPSTSVSDDGVIEASFTTIATTDCETQ